MNRKIHWRPFAHAAATAGLLLALGACSQEYPNSTFNPTTDFNTDIIALWDSLLFWGTVVFVVVEVLLLWTLWRYRRRPDGPEPTNVHGHTALEITWTVLPAVILVMIAIPTVRTIFRTQAPAPAGSLQVEVIGHQWWWEFRYPELGITTANELYIPVGRTVNFQLTTADVIHSFWIPQLGGKRDLIGNRVNHMWFTPDPAMTTQVFNGSCNEFCGTSHANMKFRTFAVQPNEFESWARHQKSAAAYPVAQQSSGALAGAQQDSAAQDSAAIAPVAAAPSGFTADSGYAFPAADLPDFARPHTPLPPGLTFTEGLTGDAERGRQIYSRTACIGCHKIEGNPISIGIIGPNLTHIASRTTIAGALYPNDTRHLSLWIKNSRVMKHGSIMPTLGKGEHDPITGAVINTGGLTDQEIADIVAYLQALK
jgi:cytochrome c oxidase subunit 2